MSALAKIVLSGYRLIHLNIFAMLLFFVIFLGALIWVYRKSGHAHYQYMQELPLQGD